MPKKLQIKLLSPVGELLQVITCFGGHVSVLRAHASGDLKPYLRALAGTHGAERLVITVDGSEYLPERHSLIGFGEPMPYVGLTCREFLGQSGISEGSIEGILVSFGLDRYGDTLCTELPADHERRLRIIAATHNYDKALIINEPFEGISNQWRERMAEYLTSAARSYNLLVVIPSLSYRPDCWIDNDVISRLQVGQSVQRTIGFGSAGSENNALMDQIRAMIRDESKNDSPSSGGASSSLGERISVSAAGASIAALGPVSTGGSEVLPNQPARSLRHRTKDALASLKGWQLGLLSFGLVLVGAGALFASQSAKAPGSVVADEAPTAVTSPQDASHVEQQAPGPDVVAEQVEQPKAPEAQGPVVAVNIQQPPQPPPPVEPPPAQFVLDLYPATIKTSLVEAARGLGIPRSSAPPEAARPETNQPSSRSGGNLFKLLEQANSNSPDTGSTGSSFQQPEGLTHSYPPGGDVMPSQPISADDEDARREQIRQKFLEAIRNSAERRQAAEAG